MSADTEQERAQRSESVLEQFQQWFHVPGLAAVLAYMLWIRTRAYDSFVTDDGVYFRGNDAYYHFRATMYSVENWPRRIFADPWTYFPYGSTSGQFGTLLDQVVATVALIVGLGDPSEQQVAEIAVLTPAVVATLCAIPVYFVAKRLSGSRLGGLTAGVVLALLPQSSWVRRGTVGFYDHHVAEAFMMVVAVFAMLVALDVVLRERPVYEQVQDRDWEGLKPSVTYSAVAGLAVALYVLVWPSAVVLAGILGVFFVVVIVAAVAGERSPEHLAFVGTISMGVATVLLLPFVQSFGFETTTISTLQVLAVFAVAVGALVLGALARYWDHEQLEPQLYPLAVGGLGIVTVGLAWVVLPDAVSTVWTNMQRIFFLGQADTTLTIGEAQSMDMDNLGEQFYTGYGFAFFTALLAAVWMAGRALFSEGSRPGYLLIVVWTVFLTLMAITQVRFHYYLVLAVAVLNGWLVVQVVQLMDFPELSAPEQVETYHVMTVIVVLMILFVPVTVGAFTDSAGTPTAADRAGNQQPGAVQLWDENLEWMSESTPQPGEFGGEDNAMNYYGSYDFESDYDYPPGAYGVLSWWDYGHWITVDGERIPTANPFQEGPRFASAFLQETDEDRANAYLEALPVRGGNLDELGDEELQELADQRTEQQAQEEVRYVTIDSQMAGGKFSAITEWAGPGGDAYTERRSQQVAGEQRQIRSRSQQYDQTMLSRLYFQDAQGLEHYRLVKEDSSQQIVASVAVQQSEGVYQPVAIGLDVLTLNQVLPQQVLRAAENPSDPRYALYDIRQESAVKTFERVEGATITGTAGANETVRATVPLETASGRQFSYVQTATADEDGSFELTVSYPTGNELGVEDGYTEPDVVANGTYTVESGQYAIGQDGRPTFQATGRSDDVEISESAIYDGGELSVDLQEVEQPAQNGSNASSVQIAGSGTATSDATASGSETDPAPTEPVTADAAAFGGLAPSPALPGASWLTDVAHYGA